MLFLGRRVFLATALFSLFIFLPACLVRNNVTRHGYIISSEALAQLQVGSSRKKIDLVMGTPSVKVGNHTYYYISELREDRIFLGPKILKRQILAVYFNDNDRVGRVANYALQDEFVVDFISKRTVEEGEEFNFVRDVLYGAILVPKI
ncbi:MAG: outer membrane protein assembly factor BamE [Alphaproteobacteria bacterium]|nr:outer membrane protein assembly factor BamE [Alphaproteobacteria bacterium]